MTARLAEDPMVGRVRRPHFIDIYFRGRPLDRNVVTEVAPNDYADLRALVGEAMEANESDEVKVPYRYMIRVYEYEEDRRGRPRRGRRIVDYIPRAEEGGHHGPGH